ncbi:ATP-binding protein [Streptosporangium soli]|nr:ATP-binding protein [Streptosporangium sp. KLBMP 9127]
METASTRTPNVSGRISTTLPRSTQAPWQARQAIRLWLTDSTPELRFNVALVVSELVTNVIQHVPAGVHRDWVEVRIGFGVDFVRLEVIDPGTSNPEPLFTPLGTEPMVQSGRGLGLVTELSIRHGTKLIGTGHRIVWADLANAQAPADGDRHGRPQEQLAS